MRTRNRQSEQRRGATVVEFAVTVPIALLVFFASLEFARANVIRHSIESAAYEAARSAIVPGATAASAEAEALQVLMAVTAINPQVTIVPTTITKQTPEVTVTISIPVEDNSWVFPKFFVGKQMTTSVTLSRERSELTAL